MVVLKYSFNIQYSRMNEYNVNTHIYCKILSDNPVPLVKSWCLKAPQHPSLMTFMTRSASSTDCIIF